MNNYYMLEVRLRIFWLQQNWYLRSFYILVTFGMASSTMYYYTQVMVKLFKDIDDVGQVSDFWGVRPFSKYILGSKAYSNSIMSSRTRQKGLQKIQRSKVIKASFPLFVFVCGERVWSQLSKVITTRPRATYSSQLLTAADRCKNTNILIRLVLLCSENK